MASVLHNYFLMEPLTILIVGGSLNLPLTLSWNFIIKLLLKSNIMESIKNYAKLTKHLAPILNLEADLNSKPILLNNINKSVREIFLTIHQNMINFLILIPLRN